jgi:hypothetical protein
VVHLDEDGVALSGGELNGHGFVLLELGVDGQFDGDAGPGGKVCECRVRHVGLR